MAESKVFRLIEGVDVGGVGRAVEAFLRDKKGLTAEGFQTPEGYLVQAKSEGGWKKLAGLEKAIKVQIIPAGELITVNVGYGSWADKAGAAVVGAVVFAPLTVTAAIGAIGQKNLPKEVFDAIEMYILSGGKTVTVTMGASEALKEGQVLCPSCKARNEKGTKFCPECGCKLG